MRTKTAVIIGAGPAGLAAAYELLEKTKIKPVVFEMSECVGGLSRTVSHHGNYSDMGPHRFFSRSERVINWWLNFLPLESKVEADAGSQGAESFVNDARGRSSVQEADKKMILKKRVSRIFAFGKFFDYPIRLNWQTFSNLGFVRVSGILWSYIQARLSPPREEKNLEDFFINRFGRKLYEMFFKSYTEKVWGVPCCQASASWGAQRVQGLSIGKVLGDAIKNAARAWRSLEQPQKTEKSLIKWFMYPRLGAGQLWEEVANRICSRGGEIHRSCEVVGLRQDDGAIVEARIRERSTGREFTVSGDYFISTMPLKDMVAALEDPVPPPVRSIGRGLLYRDLILVGLLVTKMKIKNTTKIKTANDLIPDHWIYIQEDGFRLGRLVVANNWSPRFVKDGTKAWLVLEYFCQKEDDLWQQPDDKMARFAIEELVQLGFIYHSEDVEDSMVIREAKAYPAYLGSYDQMGTLREYVDTIENLFLIGRNGTHRYNNMDHSVMSAMEAVENIANGIRSKDNIWSVNAEQDYHEKGVLRDGSNPSRNSSAY